MPKELIFFLVRDQARIRTLVRQGHGSAPGAGQDQTKRRIRADGAEPGESAQQHGNVFAVVFTAEVQKVAPVPGLAGSAISRWPVQRRTIGDFYPFTDDTRPWPDAG